MKPSRHLPRLDHFEIQKESAAKAVRPVSTLSKQFVPWSWICRCMASVIMLQTLYFKFTGAPESIYIFSQMGMEPWWRYGQGVWELIASIGLLTPRWGWAGGILTLGAMGAAIVSHLTILGIAIQNDHGLLFALALVTFLCGATVTFLHRREIPAYTPLIG